jgi:hypothetical protein
VTATDQPATDTGLPRRGETRLGQRQDGDVSCYSVTTILACIDKSQPLINWAVGTTAERTVKHLKQIERRLREEGEQSAVDYVKNLRWDTGGLLSDSALGTLAHSLFDEYALDGRRPEVHRELHPDHQSKGKVLAAEDVHTLGRMLDRFDEFLQQFQPVYRCCEIVVFDERYGVAGQADAFMAIDGVELIADYKTSRTSWTAAGKPKAPYSEASLQLAAYRHMAKAAVWRARRYENRSRRYYLFSETERAAAVPVPEVDAGIIIHVSPDRVAVHPARCGEREHQAFLFALETFRWVNEEAGSAIGEAMLPPHPPAESDDDPFEGLPQ